MVITNKKQKYFTSNFIKIIIALSLLIPPSICTAQILNADRFGSQVDSTKQFKGLFEVGANIQKQNTLLISIDTKLDLAYWQKQNLYTLVGQFNLFRSGSKNLINGGYAHARMRFKQDYWIHPEFFAQYQSNGVRGMESRVLAGANLRLKLTEDKGTRLFVGVGYMYEYERWSFAGVPDPSRFADTNPFDNHYTKVNTYISYTQKIKKIAHFQLIGYLQTRPDSFVLFPRLALQGLLRFQLSKHINFTIKYDVFYDRIPPVPIDQVFFSFINKITFTW